MNANYILKQVTLYNRFNLAGNNAVADDCLFRIGSHVDLLKPGEEINDQNRAGILEWIDRNADVFAPMDAVGRDILASLAE